MPPKGRGAAAKRGRPATPRKAKKEIKSAAVIDVSSEEEEAEINPVTPPRAKKDPPGPPPTPHTSPRKRRFPVDSEEDAAAAPSQEDVRTSPKKPRVVRAPLPSKLLDKLPQPEVFINSSPKRGGTKKAAVVSDDEDVFLEKAKPKPRPKGKASSRSAVKAFIDDEAEQISSDEEEDGEEDVEEQLDSDDGSVVVVAKAKNAKKKVVVQDTDEEVDTDSESLPDAVLPTKKSVGKQRKVVETDSEDDKPLVSPGKKGRAAKVSEEEPDDEPDDHSDEEGPVSKNALQQSARKSAPTSTPSPDTCAIPASAKDPDMRMTYKALPKLIKVSMNDIASEGPLELPPFGFWKGKVEDMEALKLLFTFVQAGRFVNPSRIDPAILTTDPTGAVKFLGSGEIACMLSPIWIGRQSQLITPGPPNSLGRESKSIFGLLHCHEFERYCAVIGMVYGFSLLEGPMYRGIMRYGTMGTIAANSSPTKVGFRKASYQAVVPSEALKIKPVLYSNETVPIYDGRGWGLKIGADFAQVLHKLPRINQELPEDSLALVGYTVTPYTPPQNPVAGVRYVNQNVMFVVLIHSSSPQVPLPSGSRSRKI
ncbi:hypothetical protein PLICRDRAFT_47460 [Plicaturopsis crispa FD-325 SS-3]|uniref:Unplaced genomic scaffold PLICRscaffold_46, whole genome shotgun sequence n=1 Tax=Plicaturopsis crispa FD-325 SS-3 TaxID=944288 RepID=A0A0C9T457_PLICR|nr:hypothetical protein PLICRDRAFT_47460 [Plicaturopsis crispa FD-325 SS-3]